MNADQTRNKMGKVEEGFRTETEEQRRGKRVGCGQAECVISIRPKIE